MVRMTGLNITAEFEDDIDPDFPESLVRGGLGYGMKRMMCINRSAPDCGECFICGTCLYGIMYSESGKTRKGLQVSPYGIHCDIIGSRALAVTLTLFGPLLGYYGHIVAVLAETGKRGIGKRRSRFRIAGVADVFAPEKKFTADAMAGFSPTVKDWLPTFEDRPGERACAVEFLSPARVERKGALLEEPAFRDIIGSCVMRYLNLERAFSDGESGVSREAKGVIENAGAVRTETSAFAWKQKERYSTRQGARISTGGITGGAVYRGNTEPFAAFLDFGSHAGIGKNTTFGCGRYRYSFE